MIVINFKNYLHNKKAFTLAKLIETYLPKAIVCPSTVDIGYISYYTKLKIFAQHVDVVASQKKSTGFVTAESVKAQGAKGSLVSHSEHQLDNSKIWNTLNELEENKMKAIVCVPTLRKAKELIKYRPYAMAFEDIELIATNKSITNYRTDDIKEFVRLLDKTKIISLCGAGVSTAEDVDAAKNLGCKGVLIASAIANSSPSRIKKFLKEIRKL